ncbi:hypothetical protein cgR_5039 [Corynebacterium glutamicum R]|uniref:Uncharacterized protein n=1 Tax=Corynebacterium glutamicum (strain R) TaxID=340322 RepID=A0AB72VCH4_CORGB|nr:hypothetical protein cgR_5039 [Corynebacterium glutamicum R]
MISAGLLIKYSPHSRGQTFKSNIFLHSNDPNLQKSTTIGQVKAICGVYSHIHSTPGMPKEEHSIPQQPEHQKHKEKGANEPTYKPDSVPVAKATGGDHPSRRSHC